jgi:hypothetical protein
MNLIEFCSANILLTSLAVPIHPNAGHSIAVATRNIQPFEGVPFARCHGVRSVPKFVLK